MLMLGGTATAAQVSSVPTFHKDVLPILQENCQSCHRPQQIAPMSFVTYQTTRPWARAIKTAVATRKMPPWFADPHYGQFENDRSLTPGEIDVIGKWVDAGAPEGNAKDAPPTIEWPPDGWQIKPDIVIDGPQFKVPAKGVVEWTDITVPSGLTKDVWVTSIELRVDPTVTHHVCIIFRPHSSDVVYNVPVWTEKVRDADGNELPEFRKSVTADAHNPDAPNTTVQFCYVPGTQYEDYRPLGAGKLVPAGTDIQFRLHYTANGKTDVMTRPQLGFTVAKEPPARQYVNFIVNSPQDPSVFAIPPNQPNWKAPLSEAVFQEEVDLVWMMSHMHVRGKDMTYQLTYPNGRTDTVLRIQNYDYNWQLSYRVKPIRIPKGTKITVTAHYDNSANNRANPDPNRTVYWGDQAWEEMMSPFFAVLAPKNVDPRKILTRLSGSAGSGAN
jgi:hypothetical protein